MKFLVDECVAWPLVEALRRRFDDVVYVREVSPAALDANVLEWAVRESRTLVTEDYDFGELVFYRQLDAEAVVIIAPGVLGVDLLADANAVVERLDAASSSLLGNLTIVERKRLRQRPLAKK